MYPRVLGYKRRSDLKEVDIKEFRATCTWDILRTWQGTILGHFGMGSQKSCNKWWCVHLLNVMHSTHQWFLFQVLKRGALATTIGSDATTYGWLYQYHSDSYTFIQKLTISSSLIKLLGYIGYFIHTNPWSNQLIIYFIFSKLQNTVA